MNKFEKLKQLLELSSNPIGVKLVYDYNKDINISSIFTEVKPERTFCEFVKRASNGEFLKIMKGDFSCKIANMAFLESNNIELTMKLDIKGLKYLLLFPINQYELENFDSIILVLNPSNCMDIIQTYVRLYNKPLKLTCGIINGVCGEITAYVIKRNDVNFSFLCTECRKNAIFSDCELLCGIPAKMTNDLVNEIIQMTQLQGSSIEMINPI